MSAENPDFDQSKLETDKQSDDLTDATGNIAYGLNQSDNDAAGQSGIDLVGTTLDTASNTANSENSDVQATTEVRKSPEKTEHIPTEQEVRGVLQELIPGPYTESRKRVDEEGLYLLEVRVQGESEDEIIEYSYIRKGHYPEGEAGNTRIDRWFYQDGDIAGGDGPVAELIDGKWKIL